MRFYLKMAWRNIFRNRKRTFLTGLIIGIGLASIMFTDAIVVGMKENMIRSVTSSFLGDAQIHREGFQEAFDSEKTVENYSELQKMLESDSNVERFTERVACFGTISSPSDINSIMLYGIDPEKEPEISKMDEAIIDGGYLNKENNGVLIGTKLAERLEVTTGDRIVLSVSNVQTGDLAQKMFRVKEGVHEVAVKFYDVQYASRHGAEFSAHYSIAGNKAETWPQLVPQ